MSPRRRSPTASTGTRGHVAEGRRSSRMAKSWKKYGHWLTGEAAATRGRNASPLLRFSARRKSEGLTNATLFPGGLAR